MLDLERIRRVIVKVCSGVDCVYALLFGSRAIGYTWDYSDVDIAIRFKDSSNCLNKALNLMSSIEDELGVHVDVIPLNIADTIVKYEAYSQGIVPFSIDNSRYLVDYINAVDEYLDFEYSFNKFYKLTVEEMRMPTPGVKARIGFWRAIKRLQKF